MAKDPAFLFYPSDWLGGTMTFTRAQKGAYMDLLIAQFNQVALTIEDIREVLRDDYDMMWERKLRDKFETESNGILYFNRKLREEVIKRKSFTESRRNNKSGKNQHSKGHTTSHMSGHKSTHMENTNEDVKRTANTSSNTVIDTIAFSFEDIWSRYPKRVGKKEAMRHFIATVKTESDIDNIYLAMENYKKSERVLRGFIQNGSTWFNNWTDWIDYKEELCVKCKGKGKYTSSTGYENTCDCPKGIGI